MRKITRRGVALAAGTVVLGLAAASGAAAQQPRGTGEVADASGSVQAANTDRTPEVTKEAGVVLECAGGADDLVASVELYQNSMYGSFLTVVLRTSEGRAFGHSEQPQPYVVDAAVHAETDVEGVPVTVSGTVTAAGGAESYHEAIQDAGYQIVTSGSHTPLAADLTLTVGAEEMVLECGTAFGYDLQTRKVALYGR